MDRVVVSGWWMACDCAAAYQVWNWLSGDGERSVVVRVEVSYWSSLGATVGGLVRLALVRGDGWMDGWMDGGGMAQMSFSLAAADMIALVNWCGGSFLALEDFGFYFKEEWSKGGRKEGRKEGVGILAVSDLGRANFVLLGFRELRRDAERGLTGSRRWK